MAARPPGGMFRLRIEPYDPDARDADNDGVVQEGTAWERPAGTRIVDLFRNEISRGQTSFQRSSQFRVVDRNGKEVRYTPTYERGIAPGATGQARQSSSPLGLPSLKERGLRPIGEGRTLGEKYRQYTERRNAAIQRIEPDDLIERQKASVRARVEQFFVGRELTDDERRIGQNTVINAMFWATTITPLGRDIGGHLNNALTGVVDSDATDALNDLRVFYESAGVAGLTVAFEGLRLRYNAGKEKVNEWTGLATEWMKRQGVRAGEISDNLKASIRAATADLAKLFRRDERDGTNLPMEFSMSTESFLRPDDFDIPEPPLPPEEIDRRQRLRGLVDAVLERPAVDGADWAAFDVVDEIENDPRAVQRELNESLDLIEALWSHRTGAPDPAFEGIDTEQVLNRADSFVRAKFHFPSVFYATYNQPPEVVRERLSAQRQAVSDLVDRIQTSNQIINASPAQMTLEQATEAYDALVVMRDSDIRADFAEFYANLPISVEAREIVEPPMRELALLFALKRRFSVLDQEQRVADRIRDLRKQNEIAARVDLNPGMMKIMVGGLSTRDLDPRLGTVSKFDGLAIMPQPTFISADETSRSLGEAIEHVRRGGSLSDIPSLMWGEVLKGASSEKDIDTTMPFRRIIPDEGANGDVSIYMLRDQDGKPTPHGWVIKGARDYETDAEVVGWSLSVAHGLAPSGAGYDGEGTLERRAFTGSEGKYAVIPFVFNHVDAASPTEINSGASTDSTYARQRLRNAEFEGNPQLFAAFLHSYLLGMTDRNTGNTIVAEHQGQPIVMPIDMTDFGKAFGKAGGDDPFSYARHEYGADSEILEKLRDYRRSLVAEQRAAFDERIATVYDSILARAKVIAAMDTDVFVSTFVDGGNPRRRNIEEARATIARLHQGYINTVEKMGTHRDMVIDFLASDKPSQRTVSARQPMPIPRVPPPGRNR